MVVVADKKCFKVDKKLPKTRKNRENLRFLCLSLARLYKKDAADYPCVNSKKSPFDQL